MPLDVSEGMGRLYPDLGDCLMSGFSFMLMPWITLPEKVHPSQEQILCPAYFYIAYQDSVGQAAPPAILWEATGPVALQCLKQGVIACTES